MLRILIWFGAPLGGWVQITYGKGLNFNVRFTSLMYLRHLSRLSRAILHKLVTHTGYKHHLGRIIHDPELQTAK